MPWTNRCCHFLYPLLALDAQYILPTARVFYLINDISVSTFYPQNLPAQRFKLWWGKFTMSLKCAYIVPRCFILDYSALYNVLSSGPYFSSLEARPPLLSTLVEQFPSIGMELSVLLGSGIITWQKRKSERERAICHCVDYRRVFSWSHWSRNKPPADRTSLHVPSSKRLGL